MTKTHGVIILSTSFNLTLSHHNNEFNGANIKHHNDYNIVPIKPEKTKFRGGMLL